LACTATTLQTDIKHSCVPHSNILSSNKKKRLIFEGRELADAATDAMPKMLHPAAKTKPNKSPLAMTLHAHTSPDTRAQQHDTP
jgi:hypothetical protein